jgi:hypothetical protein
MPRVDRGIETMLESLRQSTAVFAWRHCGGSALLIQDMHIQHRHEHRESELPNES